MLVLGNKILFARILSRFVSIAGLTLARLSLRSPTAHAAYPLLRHFPSLLLMDQSCPLPTCCSAISFSLDSDRRVASFGLRGFELEPPLRRTHRYAQTCIHKGKDIGSFFDERCTAAWILYIMPLLVPSLVLSSPTAAFPMSTGSLAHNLFEGALLRGSEKNKDITRGEKVTKGLRENYCR